MPWPENPFVSLRQHRITLSEGIRADMASDERPSDLDARIGELEDVSARLEDAVAQKRAGLTVTAPTGSGSAPVSWRSGASFRMDRASGFAHASDFTSALISAAVKGYTDPRLIENASGDIQQEAMGADGGFLLPVDKRQLQKLLTPPEGIAGRCELFLTPSNAVTLPIDDDPVWSSAMAAADVAEGAALTESKTAFKTQTLTLVKKGVLVRVTAEMLEDGSMIGPAVLNKMGEKLRWAIDKAVWTAMLASGAKITLANTYRTAGAPTLAAVQKMWTSMVVQHRETAVWLANPKLETTFQNYVVGDEPVYLMAGSRHEGVAIQGPSQLFGRPVIYSELCPAVGTAGDLALVAPSTFALAAKTAGARTDVSIHSEFVKDIVAFRSYVRVVCASKFSSTITRGDGSTAGNTIVIAA